jgi:hypothetical protein
MHILILQLTLAEERVAFAQRSNAELRSRLDEAEETNAELLAQVAKLEYKVLSRLQPSQPADSGLTSDQAVCFVDYTQ